LAGFSLGEADILRRAMGKKKREEMAAQREKFVVGCRARKIPARKAERIFDLMAEFAGYGFNKSHSCAYALLAYQTAYLKTHYPVEFVAALLTSETGSTDKVVKYINEARGMGIRVLPPDVHESGLYFTPVGEDIRFGLAAIKNVGENTAKAICEARGKVGNFQSISGFCEAIEPKFLNKRVLESLIKAGALDCLAASRGRLFAGIDQALARGQKKYQEQAVGQGGLFLSKMSLVHPESWEHSPLPEAEEWTEDQQLAGEYATLGLYISGHPLDKYAGQLQNYGATELGALESKRNGEDVVLAGIIVQSRPMRSRKGARWAIFTLQDRTGMTELLVFPEAFARLEPMMRPGAPLLVKGRINVEEVGTRVVVSDARPLEQAAQPAASLLRVRVDLGAMDTATLDRLQELLASRPGRCRVAFELLNPDGTMATLEAESGVEPAPELVAAVREICGTDSVAVV